jgi:hypothetical protein
MFTQYMYQIQMVANLFALFSSMCEQKVNAYMPSWALLVMTVSVKRNRLNVSRLESSVFVHYNLRLLFH